MLSLFSLLLSVSYVESTCQIVSTKSNFNLTEYVRSKWYVQRQQVTAYLPKSLNYCVTAEYNFTNKTVPFYKGPTLSVLNYANQEKVNGKSTNPDNFTLCARVPNASEPSKLLVAQCFFPNIFAGDYWVIDAGPNDHLYEWAIISGGQPTVEYPDGCSTKNNSFSGAGFWFFTRNQTVNSTVIENMENISRHHGFTTSQLRNVTQLGCLYH
jgi:lipocalin